VLGFRTVIIFYVLCPCGPACIQNSTAWCTQRTYNNIIRVQRFHSSSHPSFLAMARGAGGGVQMSFIAAPQGNIHTCTLLSLCRRGGGGTRVSRLGEATVWVPRRRVPRSSSQLFIFGVYYIRWQPPLHHHHCYYYKHHVVAPFG